uniref:Uncharacterized protein n=1 Tax=Cynoglossus semilaevis TaxID=244447 RepID=A0A3P8WYR2_CYNSE
MLAICFKIICKKQSVSRIHRSDQLTKSVTDRVPRVGVVLQSHSVILDLKKTKVRGQYWSPKIKFYEFFMVKRYEKFVKDKTEKILVLSHLYESNRYCFSIVSTKLVMILLH